MPDFEASELTLNSNGKVYHMDLGPDDLADTIILVGDPNRVAFVGSFLDEIRFETTNREFATITGTYQGKELSVVSTGIGTDNVDIVLNEIDAAVNINLETRTLNENRKSLDFIRIGTCGALQEDIEPGTHICSAYAVGLDGLAHFYELSESAEEAELSKGFTFATSWSDRLNTPYSFKASERLVSIVGEGMEKGITTTANGFYGPQGRAIRLALSLPDFKEGLRSLRFQDHRATNLEMETSGLYALSKGLGHSAVTICLVLANRYSGKFMSDYKVAMGELIQQTLDRLAAS